MEKSSQNICFPLPVTVTSRVTTYEQREQYLFNQLKNVLPSCDVGEIDEEIRKTFTFNKQKSNNKVIKKKLQKSPFLTLRKGILQSLNKCGKESLHFADILPLNSLWLGYMHHMLGMENFKNLPMKSYSSQWENVSQRLIKADYHGAKITIIRSITPTLVGTEGIIMQDTKNTFRIISKDNKIRTIPKESCVFRIHLENDVNIEVYGKELCIRPAERSVKKFKNLHIPDL